MSQVCHRLRVTPAVRPSDSVAQTNSTQRAGRGTDPMRHIRLMATLTAGIALAATAAIPSYADPTEPQHTTAAARPTPDPAIVRLITGDSVTVARGPDGHQTASIRPGPGRD